MTLPVEAGSLQASQTDPLVGVVIKVEPRMMRALAMDTQAADGGIKQSHGDASQALALASWDGQSPRE